MYVIASPTCSGYNNSTHAQMYLSIMEVKENASVYDLSEDVYYY